jgi:hypothetical protein
MATCCGVSSSNYNKNFSDFTYRARVKRIDHSGGLSWISGLLVRGAPGFDSYNDWRTAYEFGFNQWSGTVVLQCVAGVCTTLHSAVGSSAIKGNDWNTLGVIAHGNTFRYYINGTPIWAGSGSGPLSGLVGFYMWAGGDPTEPLDVDWATLTVGAADRGLVALPSRTSSFDGVVVPHLP